MSARIDPYLSLPLHGVQLIEASAGTGKTYTLATLYTRLVVEQGLRPGEILAVTFTEAATQELRKRIRERLSLAARELERNPDLVVVPSADAESQLSAQILRRHLLVGDESSAALGKRLRAAADEIDLAAIFTIHGFCARVLRELALESGQALDAPELLGGDRALREELAADLWRHYAADSDYVSLLAQTWPNPEALAEDLRALLQPLPLLPLPVETQDPSAALIEATQALADAIDIHAEDAAALIEAAFDRRIFDGRRARRPSFAQAFADLQAGRRAGTWPRDGHLEKLLPHNLPGFCREDQRGAAPASPLFDALHEWWQADDRWQAWQHQRRLALLHALRTQAHGRLDVLKTQRRVQTFDDLIEGVHQALAGPQGPVLIQRLRAQYRTALVDEFQDTDERQWDIFRTLFAASAQEGEDRALFLIGDPKQAIYGFRGGDVDTYLRARDEATLAPRLDRNFRSRPSVLRAIDALYANAGEEAFLKPGIRFEPVQAGDKRQDRDLLRDDRAAPALTLRVITPGETDPVGAFNAELSRQRATQACVAAIHDWLSLAQQGRAQIDGQPVRPGDIAVLVRKHGEATRIQRALAAVGIPAVAAGRQSLFATDEAQELDALLQALLHPADDGRLRTALATVLLGLDAAQLAALRDAGTPWQRHQHAALAWRARWQQDGALALITDLCAEHAPRLLELVDGERRLTNYLQLAEQLQEASTHTLGPQGLSDWLQQRIAEADIDDEAQLLRLESDAARVQIVTLHKSKGLEYPLVFLPFIGIGGGRSERGRHCTVHEQGQRVLHWKLAKDEPRWQAVVQAKAQEDAEEDARLLYVGLTRAEHALWIASGPFYQAADSAVAPMLRDLDALRSQPEIAVIEGPAEPRPPRWREPDDEPVPPARSAHRMIARDWWVYSFTQLSHADAGAEPVLAQATVEPQGGHDEPPVSEDDTAPVLAPVDPRFTSTRFGVTLHDAFERTDFQRWADWQPEQAAPEGQAQILAAALRGRGYAQEDIDDGVVTLTPLIGQTLTVTLPEGLRLADQPPQSRRAEIEFHFALEPTRVDALLDLLHAHGVVADRRGFGLRRQLEGLMTGKIDLTYQHEGRWYVLDYKSNRLPSYETRALAEAMQHSEYDLQALLYTLALHRWLRFRLGAGYDYARDFGGIRYLFCRGLDVTRADAPGIHAQQFAPELVHALDALFAAQAGAA
ncbi:exodeoxyribonuclease V subunit beta [Pseudoxanthomonas indica]|uniref:RecBCD enzyme subunit RecB n=1 Tax=Pseudoxanthomonas indica TaxID=428993 RepID=A0A1T5KP88_9GAMM|nr:exodeoxyribonuclease V subunit beta [Pseudoxanthomonas indica]GGD50534.1 RecBCD enzyme subunit RecB [Pseudoxanthomonas indica]SKC65441.1 DNA helicase/exodeoxyribonuclease V, beta subunit [Pseudoxanthomonas indica]